MALVFILYGQTVRHGFVNLDDPSYIYENPHVRAGLGWDGIVWSFTALRPNWHPVTWWTHMLDVELFGLWAGGHHLVSVGVHATNGVLLFLALRLLTGALWPSALAAALFAVHPLRVESVAWLSERKDVMSGLFWMLTLLAYGWYARRPAPRRYLLVALALAFGLMAKTMLVSLPFVLLLLDVWPLARWRLPGPRMATPSPAGAEPASLSWLIVEKLPLVALSVAASLLTIQTQQTISGVRSLEEVPLPWRVANAPLAAVAYLRKTVWPSDLAVIYPHPALLGGAALGDIVWPAVGAVMFLAAVSVACIAQARRRRYLAVGWFWYLIALVPVIGLVQVGMQAMADRYTYLSVPGIYVMLAWSLRDLLAQRRRLRRPVVAAAAAGIGALAVVTWFQVQTWRDSFALFRHALQVTDDNYFAHSNLGLLLRGEGKLEAAAAEFERAIQIKPDDAFSRTNLGVVFEMQGDFVRAAAEHERALRIDPDSATAHTNLGAALGRQGQLAAAVTEFERALRLNPGNMLAYTNLGAVLVQQGRFAEAATVLERALRIQPDSVDGHNNLGVALAKQGKFAAAAAEFEQVLRINPNHAQARRSLGYVRARLRPSS